MGPPWEEGQQFFATGAARNLFNRARDHPRLQNSSTMIASVTRQPKMPAIQQTAASRSFSVRLLYIAVVLCLMVVPVFNAVLTPVCIRPIFYYIRNIEDFAILRCFFA
jgi:hypothetical protein